MTRLFSVGEAVRSPWRTQPARDICLGHQSYHYINPNSSSLPRGYPFLFHVRLPHYPSPKVRSPTGQLILLQCPLRSSLPPGTATQLVSLLSIGTPVLYTSEDVPRPPVFTTLFHHPAYGGVFWPASSHRHPALSPLSDPPNLHQSSVQFKNNWHLLSCHYVQGLPGAMTSVSFEVDSVSKLGQERQTKVHFLFQSPLSVLFCC